MRLGKIVLDRVGELSGAGKRYPEFIGQTVLVHFSADFTDS